MKSHFIVSLFALSIAASPVFAEEAHHPAEPATEKSGSAVAAQPGGGMGMMQMHGMQQHMDRMHATMEKARQAKSTDERRRLMQEHMQEMHKAMGTMQGMTKDKGMSVMPMEKRMEGMEMRMEMMRRMMQQMLDQQSMMMDMSADTENR